MRALKRPALVFFGSFALVIGAIGLLFVPLAGGPTVIPGESLNLFSMLGLVMLVGLVAKNGILLVDYANTLRAKGMPLLEAIRESATIRFRPIVMTTVAMIAGMMPLALGITEGAEFRKSMGTVITGGLTSSLFLTLFLVPVVYVWIMSRVDRAAQRRLERTAAARAGRGRAVIGVVAPSRRRSALHRRTELHEHPLEATPEHDPVEHRIEEVRDRAEPARVGALVVLRVVRGRLQEPEPLQRRDPARRVRAVRPQVHLVRLRRERDDQVRFPRVHAAQRHHARGDRREHDADAIRGPVVAGANQTRLAMVLDVVAHDVPIEQLRAPGRGPRVLGPVEHAGQQVDDEQAFDGVGEVEHDGWQGVHRKTSRKVRCTHCRPAHTGERP